MLIVVMLVLYVAGDWFLLGLALLVLIGAAIGLRNTLPRYIDEARLFLNMGPVREGERVIYGGLPWRIRSLNIYSTLFNPDLQGGVLRLPSSEMAKLTSRPDHKTEPWFPTRTGDVVLLEGDVMAKVLLQTPEVVRLRYKGAVRDVPTASFVGMAKHNLSQDGFVAAATFGIDYAHQRHLRGPGRPQVPRGGGGPIRCRLRRSARLRHGHLQGGRDQLARLSDRCRHAVQRRRGLLHRPAGHPADLRDGLQYPGLGHPLPPTGGPRRGGTPSTRGHSVTKERSS